MSGRNSRKGGGMSDVHVGCSGFCYSSWRGNFYPKDLPRNEWLRYYCKHFSTVELNVTFYRLPLPETFDAWYRQTPPGFVFALKGSRFVTHVKRLLDPDEHVERFFERALRLREKLRVVLWQLPPGFALASDRLSTFLAGLDKYGVRNALEFRNRSWLADEVLELCGKHDVSMCSADWPDFLDDLPLTADFVYFRRHGAGGNYASRYTESQLRNDSKRILKYLHDGREVFIYFNNDTRGHAPANALELLEMVR
jgi:uncharacterized protein YecE (DUF72 family)